MVIHGPTGCGKSVIASFIYDELERLHEITLLFFSSSGDATRRTLDSLARALLAQLLEKDKEGRLVPFFSSLMENGLFLIFDLFDAVGKAVKLLSWPVKVIIDGIDECSDTGSDIFTYMMKSTDEEAELRIIFLG